MPRGNYLHPALFAWKLVPAVSRVFRFQPVCLMPAATGVSLRPRPAVRAGLALTFIALTVAMPSYALSGRAGISPVSGGNLGNPGNLVAFFSLPQDPVSGSATGRLVSFSAPDRSGYSEMVLADANGVEHCVAWRGGRRSPYLVPNTRYSVMVEHHVSPVAASSIVIRDEQGIVYAGATDRQPAESVLKRGLAGFAIAIENPAASTGSGALTSHTAAAPWLAIAPSLRIDHDGLTVNLHSGDSARLGDYEVVCLSLPSFESGQAAGVLSWFVVRSRADSDEPNLAAADRR